MPCCSKLPRLLARPNPNVNRAFSWTHRKDALKEQARCFCLRFFVFFFLGGGGRNFLRDWDAMVTITIFHHHLGFHIFFQASKIQIQVVGEVKGGRKKKHGKNLMQFFGFYFGACHETSQVCFLGSWRLVEASGGFFYSNTNPWPEAMGGLYIYLYWFTITI